VSDWECRTERTTSFRARLAVSKQRPLR